MTYHLPAAQAKHLPDDLVIEAVAALEAETARRWGHRWASVDRWSLARSIGAPDAVVLAKLRRLVRRGCLSGCWCGCRGDFHLPRVACGCGETPCEALWCPDDLARHR